MPDTEGEVGLAGGISESAGRSNCKNHSPILAACAAISSLSSAIFLCAWARLLAAVILALDIRFPHVVKNGFRKWTMSAVYPRGLFARPIIPTIVLPEKKGRPMNRFKGGWPGGRPPRRGSEYGSLEMTALPVVMTRPKRDWRF